MYALSDRGIYIFVFYQLCRKITPYRGLENRKTLHFDFVDDFLHEKLGGGERKHKNLLRFII